MKKETQSQKVITFDENGKENNLSFTQMINVGKDIYVLGTDKKIYLLKPIKGKKKK